MFTFMKDDSLHGVMALSITTLSTMTLSIVTLSIVTPGIATHAIMDLFATLGTMTLNITSQY